MSSLSSVLGEIQMFGKVSSFLTGCGQTGKTIFSLDSGRILLLSSSFWNSVGVVKGERFDEVIRWLRHMRWSRVLCRYFKRSSLKAVISHISRFLQDIRRLYWRLWCSFTFREFCTPCRRFNFMMRLLVQSSVAEV